MAIPLGRLVDNWSRRKVVFGGALLFSGATFFCGLSRSFGALFVGRMAVGVGEATLTPAAFSLIGDYIRKQRMAFAISVFIGSSYVGGGFALVVVGGMMAWLGGMVIDLPFIGVVSDWQLAFMLAASPGIIFSLAVLFTVREPPRIGTAHAGPSVPLVEIWLFLKKNAYLFAPIMLGLPLVAGANFALNAWAPSFFIRTYGWTPAQIGPVFGTMVLSLSTAGVIVGGIIADRLVAQGKKDANLRVPMITALLAAPFAIAFPMADTAFSSLVLIAPVVFFGAMPFGAGSSAIPSLAPNRMRGQLTAIFMLLANLIGGGFGPWVLAAYTDLVLRDDSLIRYSMSAVIPTLFAAGALGMFFGIRGLRRGTVDLSDS
jgi:MFS family permease